MPVNPRSLLVINTYAGSLLVAAALAECRVLISLEDKGYGVKTQRLNFPRLSVVDQLPWPEPGMSLRDVIAVAHPPCSCFSIQGVNASPRTRGLASPAFSSTRRATEYALARDVAALLVESVIGTLEGARVYHTWVAEHHGYHLYRVLQNAITFGVPQWRPRLWCVYVKKGHAPLRLRLGLSENFLTVGDVLADVKLGAPLFYVSREFERYRDKLRAVGLDLARVLAQGPGSLPYLVARFLGDAREGDPKSKVEARVADALGFTRFSSAWPTQLSSTGFAPTLLGTSHWWYEGRPLTRPEYCALAGFPPDYRFDNEREVQAYLSRGVAPPVATWLLREVDRHLRGERPSAQAASKILEADPGGTLDFRVSRRELLRRRLFNEVES